MRNDRSEMPLTSHDNLRLDKPVEESIKVECFPESFMKKFTDGAGETTENMTRYLMILME